MKKIGVRLHRVIDYIVGISLLTIPLFFEYVTNSAQTWTLVGVGVIMMLYNLLTDYEGRAIRGLSMPVHLVFDISSGMFLVISPWLFEFSTIVWAPHLLAGGIVFLTAAMTRIRTVPRILRPRKIHKTIYRRFSIR